MAGMAFPGSANRIESGRLPERPRAGRPPIHRGARYGFRPQTHGLQPQFALGSGLSYTTFAYSDLRVDGFQVRVTVTNTGHRAGRDIVLLFTHQHDGPLPPAMRRLTRFEAVDLAPGASRVVTFTLNRDDVAEPGDFDAMVGNLTRTFTIGP